MSTLRFLLYSPIKIFVNDIYLKNHLFNFWTELCWFIFIRTFIVQKISSNLTKEYKTKQKKSAPQINIFMIL